MPGSHSPTENAFTVEKGRIHISLLQTVSATYLQEESDLQANSELTKQTQRGSMVNSLK